MVKKTSCIYLMLALLVISQGAFADPYRGEEELVLLSGLTGNQKLVGCEADSQERFKTSFDRNTKKIIYWITVDLAQLKSYNTLQSIEWYMPNGKIWIKENRDIFKEGSLVAAKSCMKDIAYQLKVSDIPPEADGVWALRFMWSGRQVEERYFRLGSDMARPSDMEISELKARMKKYNDALSMSEKDTQFKYESYLCNDSSGYYHEQTISQPRFSFSPDEKIKYTLNLIPSSMGEIPITRLFLFSPDGKIQKKYNLAPFAPRTAYKPSSFSEQKIDLKKIIAGMPDPKAAPGLWKSQTHYLDTDMPMDERYFYVGREEHDSISPEDIKALDGKIKREDIIASLDWAEKNIIKNSPRLNWNKELKEKKKLKIGMPRDEVIAIMGNPDKILTNVYDDAEVFIYLNPRDITGRDLPSLGVAIAIDILTAQKLKVIIKEDRVIGIRRGA